MKTRAAVLHTLDKQAPVAQSQPLKIEEIDLDAPGLGEVLIKLTAAGLCHSDLSVITGVRPRPVPMALGHEASGTVVEVGVGVHDLKPGDRVVLVFVPSCGYCMPCMEEKITHTENKKERPKCPNCKKVLKYEQNYIENPNIKPIEQTHTIVMAHNLNILHYMYKKICM